MPALQQARKKTRYARWLGYSNNLRCDSRLVAYWNFEEEEGSKLKNKAVGPYGDTRYAPENVNGTIYGAAWVKDGGRWPGKGALDFDGTDDYINCGHDASLNVNDFTVEVWFNCDSISSSPEYYGLLVGKYRYDGQRAFYHRIRGLSFEPGVCKGNTDAESNEITTHAPPASPLIANQWHHTALKYEYVGDGSSIMTIYLDGVELSEKKTNCVGPLNITTQDVWIGRDATYGGLYPFSGTIDEVAIYNQALSASEIKSHYRMGKP